MVPDDVGKKRSVRDATAWSAATSLLQRADLEWRAANRVVERICQHSSALVPHVRALYHEWKDASLPKRKPLALRLCNLSYLIWIDEARTLLPDPEACPTTLELMLRWAGEECWLSAHLKTQLANERPHGWLEEPTVQR